MSNQCEYCGSFGDCYDHCSKHFQTEIDRLSEENAKLWDAMATWQAQRDEARELVRQCAALETGRGISLMDHIRECEKAVARWGGEG